MQEQQLEKKERIQHLEDDLDALRRHIELLKLKIEGSSKSKE